MDPRRPEEALERIDQLINQFRHILDKLRTEAVSSRLAEAEREGALVVQEICLVAPRLHEAMMQTSRQRRHDLSRGILIEPQDTVVETPQGDMFEPEIVEKPVEEPLVIEKLVETELDKEVDEILKPLEEPKKKTTRKKKTTKKADK